MYRKFKDLKLGDRFIQVRHIVGDAWAPLYRKTMENVQVAFESRRAPVLVNAIDRTGCLVTVPPDEEVIEVR